MAQTAHHACGVRFYAQRVLIVGAIFSNASSGAGLMAASIAVGGFVAHARPALRGQGDPTVRFATVVGGLAGLAIAVLVIAGAILGT